MAPTRTLVMVLAGGAGSRLELLTRDRAKPVVPFGGAHRLIDVVLSNCRHSGISDVWVVQQQHPASLAAALANGRPWDLDRTVGGLLVLPPARGGEREGWHHGTADAVWKQAALIRDFAPEALVVLSSDAVYRMDYADVVDGHRRSGAAVTMVTTRLDADVSRYGVVRPGRGDRIREYVYKPKEPGSDLIATEVFVMDPAVILDRLERLARSMTDGDDLGDLGDALLPGLVDDGLAREHRFTGYWRDLGTVEAYWRAHQDLLGTGPAFDLADETWPLLGATTTLVPARVHAGAQIRDALLAPGSAVAGTVDRTVLAPGAVVERGATVSRSVLLPGAVVRSGAVVTKTVLDDGVTVGRDARVGDPRGRVTLIGAHTTVRRGSVVGPGERRPRAAADDDR